MQLPLADIRIRDPFILADKDSGRYYLYGTTDPDPWHGPGGGFDCYTSTDLKMWEGPFPAFRAPEAFWATTQFWAPEVFRTKNGYLMLASFAGKGRPRGTQPLYAAGPLGPFEPAVGGPITDGTTNSLDGTLWEDSEGTWLVYCREWTDVGDGQIVAQRLDANLRPLGDEPAVLFAASQAPWANPINPEEHYGIEEAYVTDGPFLFETEGQLHMLWSSFAAGDYALGVATSKTGEVTGPWLHPSEPLLTGGAGHAMIFEDFQGEAKLVYHSPNQVPLERATIAEFSELLPGRPRLYGSAKN